MTTANSLLWVIVKIELHESMAACQHFIFLIGLALELGLQFVCNDNVIVKDGPKLEFSSRN